MGYYWRTFRAKFIGYLCNSLYQGKRMKKGKNCVSSGELLKPILVSLCNDSLKVDLRVLSL